LPAWENSDALLALRHSFPHARIIVLEQDGEKSACKSLPPVSIIEGDAASLLLDAPLFHAEDLIIPMVPFNLAASYVLAKHANTHEIPVPEEMLDLLPNPMVVNESNIVCSRADFVCPDDCPEGEICTVTGKPREPLYDALGRLELPGYSVLVQRSSQILPGWEVIGWEISTGLLPCGQRKIPHCHLVQMPRDFDRYHWMMSPCPLFPDIS
jgi:hypothetical protein